MSISNTHAAPGQAAGYFFQIERALARLAEMDADSAVAVEKENDVSVHLADGHLLLEEDKHTTSGRSPFSDNSKSLWNTLDIWTELAERRQIDPFKCKFCLVTNVAIPPSLARQIGDTTSAHVESCIAFLRSTADKAPAATKEYANRFFGRDPAILRAVLINTECLDSSTASSGDQLRRRVSSQLHLPNDVDSIELLNLLHGWVANQLLTAWRNNQPGIIQRQHFDQQLHRQINRFRRYRRIGLPEHLVPFSKDQIQSHRKKRYVKQIRAVTQESAEAIDAITDFIRCTTERFRLSNVGDLTIDDWQSFEDHLCRSWRNIFLREVRLRKDEDETEVGYRILCDSRSIAASLDGEAAHRYLIVGTLHRFADQKTIGWHPRYEELIK